MPFDLIAWAESQAANGLTATTGVTDTRYRTSGDTQRVRSIGQQPFVAAMWGGSVTATKFEEGEIRSAGKVIYDHCAGLGPRDGGPILLCGSPLIPEDTLTGYVDNANTAEITAMITAIAYGGPDIYSPVPVKAAIPLGLASTTDTAGTLPAGWVTASTTWTGLQPQRKYEIVGIGGWGTLDVAVRLSATTDLASAYKPGVPLGTTSANQPMTYLREPYPFIGSSPPDLEIQSLGASAEHHLTVLIA